MALKNRVRNAVLSAICRVAHEIQQSISSAAGQTAQVNSPALPPASSGEADGSPPVLPNQHLVQRIRVAVNTIRDSPNHVQHYESVVSFATMGTRKSGTKIEYTAQALDKMIRQ